MSNLNFPDNIFGINAKEAYDRIINAPDKKPEDKPNPDKQKSEGGIGTAGSDLENYILLPQTTEHPDLLIAKTRLAYDYEVEKAGKKLGLTLQNNKQGYIGDINWEQALKLNNELGSFTLNPKLFAEFLKLLKYGRALDGTKKQVNSRELETILNEIIEVKTPYRSEWLDNKYVKQGGVLGIGSKLAVTYNKFVNGKLIEATAVLDSDTLMETKTPGIDLDSWIENPNSQGLPRSSVKDGSLYFWHPSDGRVAWFDAGTIRVGLSCYRGPLESNAVLGVRQAKVFGGIGSKS